VDEKPDTVIPVAPVDEPKKEAPESVPAKAVEPEPEKPSGAEKRINELVGEVKSLKHQVEQSKADKKRMEDLEAELAELRQAVKPEKSQDQVLAEKEAERIAKALADDKVLPREKKREMSKEELEEWFVEDPTSAQEWISSRAIRRERERSADAESFGANRKAQDILRKQDISQARVLSKHPDLDTRGRVEALKAEGKTLPEIQAIMQKENPSGFKKAQVIAAILKEDQERYLLAENGPELLVQEMERRMSQKPEAPKETQEERDERIRTEAVEAERLRIASVDSNGQSSRGAAPAVKRSEEYKTGYAVYKRAFPKATEADYDKALERRAGIPGTR
jgi:hypothetical protein